MTPSPPKVRINHLRQWKKDGRRIVMVTAHDTVSASVAEEAGVDVILVGDSLGMTHLGYRDTIRVTVEEMLHHCRAVARGARVPLLVGDMPFMSYKISREQALDNAARFIQDGRMEAVKVEGATPAMIEIVHAIVEAGIPVMAHIGLTPQSVHLLSGFKVQGKHPEEIERLRHDARALEEAGAFSIVVEAVPEAIGQLITAEVGIPTIGIGAGRFTDGQVLVYADLLGITPGEPFRFVKQYKQLRRDMIEGVRAYAEDVRAGRFPDKEHSY
ncbi:MAG: 3-methyl-2-oxobutanoate hydroxymethyltransferase [Candidatus Sumerlaeia bacterium]